MEDKGMGFVGDDSGAFGEPFESSDGRGLEDVEDAEDYESGDQRWQICRKKATPEDKRDGDDFVEHHLSGVFVAEQSTGTSADRDCDRCSDQGDQQTKAQDAHPRAGQKWRGDHGDGPGPSQAQDTSGSARCPGRTACAQAGGQQQDQVVNCGQTGVAVTVAQLFSPFGDEYTRVLSANSLPYPHRNDPADA